jgi:hypothetical protein
MKTVIIDGIEYQGNLLYVSDSSIGLYDNETCVISLDGIQNWDNISYTGNIDETKVQKIQRLEEIIEDLILNIGGV